MPNEEMKEEHHALSMQDCKSLTLSGVREVYSFDDLTVSLETSLGALSVEGENLHISHLDLERGEAAIDGTVSALYYTHKKERGGFFGRGKR